KEGRELLGTALQRLSQAELKAYAGSNGKDYDALLQELENIESSVEATAGHYFDYSLIARYRSVNVLDVQLDEPTRLHFLSRAKVSFWSVYSKIKGQRAFLENFLKDGT